VKDPRKSERGHRDHFVRHLFEYHGFHHEKEQILCRNSVKHLTIIDPRYINMLRIHLTWNGDLLGLLDQGLSPITHMGIVHLSKLRESSVVV
jgi:hypothetical protein